MTERRDPTPTNRPEPMPVSRPAPRRTMPPPELMDRPAPASVGGLVLQMQRAKAPIDRRSGARADEAYLRGRVVERVESGDLEGEREAALELARLLASRGTDLDGATRYARRALAIRDDGALRTELAGWLAGLGEAALAAATLRGLCDPATPVETARTLVKIAVLLARADDAAGAADSLREAASTDKREAMALELLGTLAAWAPREVEPMAAAEAYLDAAARREAAKDKEAAFEDRLRAFEIAPEHRGAADSMSSALKLQGRAGAADEVMRAHADAVAATDRGRALAVHRERMLHALEDGDAARAIGAALDAELEGDLTSEVSASVDEALMLGGLSELCAARLEARADVERGPARSATFAALARLYSGALQSPERAIEAWIEASASDPTAEAPREALRAHALSMQDPSPLVEALIRISLSNEASKDARAGALVELAQIAEEKIADAGLATWALDRLVELGADGDRARGDRARLEPRRRQQDEALATAKRTASGASSPEAKFEAQRRMATILRGRPEQTQEALEVLADLARALPDERSFWLALDRLSARHHDYAALEAALRERLERSPGRSDLVRTRLALAAIARRRGDEAGAAAEVLPLLDEVPGQRAAACSALLFATRAGRPIERAHAIVQLAGPAIASLKSTLLAVAAGIYARAPRPELARKTALLGGEAEPGNARAVATLAAIAGKLMDRTAAKAVERAMGIVLPRGVLCDELAQALEAMDEPALALAWTQRWLALRPGSPRAMAELLRRAVMTGDAARLADSIGWVLAQPKPLADLADPIADALVSLFAVERGKARGLAKRALDVIGPRAATLRSRLLALAEQAKDPALGIAVLERHLAANADDAQHDELLLELARRRTNAGDFDGAARELSRAAARDADPNKVFALLEALEEEAKNAADPFSSDGLVSLAETRALVLTGLGPDSAKAAALAWREVGGLRWDLAEDQEGAEDAFFAASFLDVENGPERYANDLVDFAGEDEAIEILVARAQSIEAPANEDPEIGRPSTRVRPASERRARANLLVQAALVAAFKDDFARAAVIAAQAIDADPARADAIAIVEKGAHLEGGIDLLDRTYRHLADAALGRYGKRAAHYRAARQLEKRGVVDRALEHAVAAFEAVPSEGQALQLVSRLSERAGDAAPAVAAIERIAEKSEKNAKTAWLKRAANLSSRSADGLKKRIELLLRALNVVPDPATAYDIGAAVVALLAITGDLEDVMERIEASLRAALPRLDGPDGSRAAIAMAEVAVGLGAGDLAFAALERAAKVDGDLEEFAKLRPMAQKLADANGAAAWLDSVVAAAAKPYSSVGPSLLQLAAEVASARGDKPAAARLLIQAAKRSDDDHALIDEAVRACEAAGDPEIAELLGESIPMSRRLEASLAYSLKLEQEGDDATAQAALERALASPDLFGEARQRATTRLKNLLVRTEQTDAVQRLLEIEMKRAAGSADVRIALARELAAYLSTRREHQRAVDVLLNAAAGATLEPAVADEIRTIAQREGNPSWYADVLVRLGERLDQGEARVAVLRELKTLREGLGDRKSALALLDELTKIDPKDSAALEELERDAEERGDHEAIAAILARKIQATDDADQRRTWRLRRVVVLEQRLSRENEARAELEAMIAEAPDDKSAYRFLADMHERRGAATDAAAALEKLGALAQSADEKVEYGLRACRTYLNAGDVDAAERALDAVAAIAERENVVEIRVEIARKRGDVRGLADALDQLAATSRESPEKRAELLLEAARSAVSIGDEAAALDRARRAAQLAPSSPAAVIEARRLEYKLGGSGAPREAQAAAADLQRIASALTPDQVELHAFLLAEELDVVQGGQAGMRELTKRHAEIGAAPLVALGMAERLVRLRNFEQALPLFERALEGDLHGLRTRGRLALDAADAAKNAGELDLADGHLAIAEAEPETRALASKRKLEVESMRGDPARARRALEELARITTGVERARALAQLAKIVATSDPIEAEKIYDEAAPLSVFDRQLKQQIEREKQRLHPTEQPTTIEPPPLPEDRISPPPSPEPFDPPGVVVSPSGAPPPPPSQPSPALPPPLPVPGAFASTPRAPSPVEVEIAPSSGPLYPSPIPEPPPSIAMPEATVDDQAMWRALIDGSFEAGERLLEHIPGKGEHTRDVVAIRRKQASIKLGDRAALDRLHEAAVLDHDLTFSRAIQHILQSCFTLGADPIARALDPSSNAPPPLSAQRDAPELLRALLFGAATLPAHEALAIVWETGLFKREIASYALAGTDRVQLGVQTTVGEVYTAAARLLDLGRAALYHRKIPGPIEARIALLVPPSVVVSGEAREDNAELRYAIGAALAGATPEHVLINALDEVTLASIEAALVASFGPVGGPRASAQVARLGQDLWQLVPPRASRRLREIFEAPGTFSLDAARAVTRQAMRRAGLFASGSLLTALARTALELGVDLERALAAPDGLARVCAEHEPFADLTRLAIRREFAEARWQSVSPADRRRDAALRPRAGT